MTPTIKGPITIGRNMSKEDIAKLEPYLSLKGQLKRLNKAKKGEEPKKKTRSKKKDNPGFIARAARKLKKTVDDLADDGKLNDSVGENDA
jgi:hypothetical protein